MSKIKQFLIAIVTALGLFSTASAQTTLKVVYDQASSSYQVWAKSTTAYSASQSRFVNVFVSLVVPTGTGASQFLPTAITTNPALVGGGATNVFTLSRYNTPSENTSSDYLFFNMDVGNAAYTPIAIAANVEFMLFSFKNSNTCAGNIAIMDPTSDPFMTPNAESINSGNAFSVYGAGGDTYSGIYGGAASCTTVAPAQTFLKVLYDTPSQTYQVWAKTTSPFSPPSSRFVNVFVTLEAPTGTGTGQFVPTALTTNPALVGGGATNIFTVSRYNAPSENTSKDYLFFNMDVGNAAYTPISITANTDYLLFSFKSANGCLGNISVMDPTTDPFKVPNAESINAGNAFSIQGAGGDTYAGIYGSAAAVCVVPPVITVSITNPLTAGQAGTLTLTATNSTGNPAQSGLGYVYVIPTGLTIPAGSTVTNSCGGTATASGGNTLTFTGGSMSSGTATCTVSVPVVAAAAGTINPTTGSFPSVTNVTAAPNNGAGSNPTTITVNPATASCTANAGTLTY